MARRLTQLLAVQRARAAAEEAAEEALLGGFRHVARQEQLAQHLAQPRAARQTGLADTIIRSTTNLPSLPRKKSPQFATQLKTCHL